MVKILTSGFPNGFPNDFKRIIKTYFRRAAGTFRKISFVRNM
ncbi:MAG: hypothetical protein E6600_12715 [Anaerocolumna aminovalerica]|nr:hypothetical protein [Anaerocolumna aminovalerica]MDU6265352.1 hypothetical protein [Anaerocolumna aminovalerica]